jgi:hypothetical protein
MPSRRHEDDRRAIAASPAFSIAGGGDTIAAINKFGIADRISYISTAGGAFLEFLEGKTLPAVALEARRPRRRSVCRRSCVAQRRRGFAHSFVTQ